MSELLLDPLTDEGELIRRSLAAYGASPLFADPDAWVVEDNPYRRPLRPEALGDLVLSRPLTRDTVLSDDSLTAHRALRTVYENDVLLFPRREFASKRADFESFYGRRNATLGTLLRPSLESFLFSFLDSAVAVPNWRTVEELKEHLQGYLAEEGRRTEDRTVAAVLGSTSPIQAVKALLIQSEAFNGTLDENGAAYPGQRGTLFEKVLERVGLASTPHVYWQFFLTSSLLLRNYYDYLRRDHTHCFRYLGALFQAEAAFTAACDRRAGLLHTVFGASAEVRYFQEQAHAGGNRVRMILEQRILPTIEACGEEIIPDIARGFEEGRLLARYAEQDFIDQVAWSDRGDEHKARAAAIRAERGVGGIESTWRCVEPRGKLTVTRVHGSDVLCCVELGALRIVTGHERQVVLSEGESLWIPRHRLYGVQIESAMCTYELCSLG